MCPRSFPLPTREQHTGEACARHALHALNASAENGKHGIPLDAGLYANAPDGKNANWLTGDEQARFKYALNLDGATAAFRLRSLLAGGQAVIMDANSALYEWYYPMLEPWKHYIPLGDQYTSVFELARFLREHDSLASEIAVQGQKIGVAVTREHGLCYARFLVEEYAKLLTFRPQRGAGSVPLADALHHLRRQSKQVYQHLGWQGDDLAGMFPDLEEDSAADAA